MSVKSIKEYKSKKLLYSGYSAKMLKNVLVLCLYWKLLNVYNNNLMIILSKVLSNNLWRWLIYP